MGIAGKVSEKVKLSDVVVGRHVLQWDAKRKEQAVRGGETETNYSITPAPSAQWGANLANLAKSDKNVYGEWQAQCVKDKPSGLDKGVPELHVEDIASGSATIDSEAMREMLEHLSRYLFAVETEAAAALNAFHSRDPSALSILIRGISDLSAGKGESDAVGQGAWRRYAARNAAKLLVSLLSKYRIPYEGPPRHFMALHKTPCDEMLPAWIGYEPLDVLVPYDACQVVFMGQNLSSRLGLNEKNREKFAEELRSLLEQGTDVSLVIMPPSVLKVVHLEAAEDLAHYTLPALEQLIKVLGELGDRVRVVFHPAATLSLLAVDGKYAYITPKFQKTQQISTRLTILLEPRLFDGASLERMFAEAEKKANGASALPLNEGVAALRTQLVACGLLQSVSEKGGARVSEEGGASVRPG